MNLVASLGLGPKRVRRRGGTEVAPVAAEAPVPDGDARHIALVFRFAWWAHQLRHFPNVRQIQDRFEVSRATAYRWRDLLAAAHGIETPADTSHYEGID